MKRYPLHGGRCYNQGKKYKQAILERDGHRCQLCGCGIGQVCNLHYAPVSQLDVAHIPPWQEAHLSTPDTQRILCHPCNVRERYHTQCQPVYA